jgi:hypothetical protein
MNILREENEQTNMLTKSMTSGLPLPTEVLFEVLKTPSIDLQKRTALNILLVHNENRRFKIISFLTNTTQMNDEAWISQMKLRARPYKLIEEELYKEDVYAPLLKIFTLI